MATMMEIPGSMDITLVAHYGPKSEQLTEFIRFYQDKLSSLLSSAFRPYELEQVHGTIIGLEGRRVGDQILNLNYERVSPNANVAMQLSAIVQFLRSADSTSMEIRIGGFRYSDDFPFTARGQHPYLRSFSIQGTTPVAMGWPYENGTNCEVLEGLRRSFNRFGALHKWHDRPNVVDNDFYFVLGTIDKQHSTQAKLEDATEQMRVSLAGMTPLTVAIAQESLFIVGYQDPGLPRATSCWFQIDDPSLTVERIKRLYRER